jgi:hypothetical protein
MPARVLAGCWLRRRSEASFDPEQAEAAANMSLNSTKSFDPEDLHFEATSASLGYAQDGLDHGGQHAGSEDEASQDSDASFDPEAARKDTSRSGSMSSEASFDAEAGAQSPLSQASQASLDPEAQAASPARRASPASEMSFGSAVSYDPQESVVDGAPGRPPLDLRACHSIFSTALGRLYIYIYA